MSDIVYDGGKSIEVPLRWWDTPPKDGAPGVVERAAPAEPRRPVAQIILKRRLCEKWCGHRFESGACARCGRYEHHAFLPEWTRESMTRSMLIGAFEWTNPRLPAVLEQWPGYAKVIEQRNAARTAAANRVQHYCDECGQKLRR